MYFLIHHRWNLICGQREWGKRRKSAIFSFSGAALRRFAKRYAKLSEPERLNAVHHHHRSSADYPINSEKWSPSFFLVSLFHGHGMWRKSVNSCSWSYHLASLGSVTSLIAFGRICSISLSLSLSICLRVSIYFGARRIRMVLVCLEQKEKILDCHPLSSSGSPYPRENEKVTRIR